MHELGIAQAIVDVVVEEAQGAEATRVVSVLLTLGELSGVVEEQLRFCFPIVAKATLLDGAELKVERVPGEGFCARCQATYHLPSLLATCPSCGDYASEVRGGQELRVTSLEVE